MSLSCSLTPRWIESYFWVQKLGPYRSNMTHNPVWFDYLPPASVQLQHLSLSLKGKERWGGMGTSWRDSHGYWLGLDERSESLYPSSFRILLMLQWWWKGSVLLHRKFTQRSVSQESLGSSPDCSEGLTHYITLMGYLTFLSAKYAVRPSAAARFTGEMSKHMSVCEAAQVHLKHLLLISKHVVQLLFYTLVYSPTFDVWLSCLH